MLDFNDINVQYSTAELRRPWVAYIHVTNGSLLSLHQRVKFSEV